MDSTGTSGGLSASALAASISGNRASGGSPDVQRWAGASPSSSTEQSSGPKLGGHRGPPPVPSREGRGELNLGDQLNNSAEAKEWFADQLDKNFDRLVHALEDRMIVEFERRGGRLWDGL